MRRRPHSSLATPALLALLAACGSGVPAPVYGQPGTRAAFALQQDTSAEGAFFDFPFPSDWRLREDGRPDWRGLPNPRRVPMVESFRAIAADAKGTSVLATAWFRFDAPIAPRALEAVAAERSAPVLLVDVDPASPERGRLFPLVLSTPPADDYVPENLLAVAARPGFVLHAGRAYAFVVMRSLADAAGRPLGVPGDLDRLRRGLAPPGLAGADRALALHAPLWETLRALGVDDAQVAAAAVFTTGDAVADTAALSDRVLAGRAVALEGVALDAAGSAANDRLCRLTATVRQPQFQRGKPPFDSEGLFEAGPDGLPVQQREEATPVVLNLPRTPMPAGGYPLVLYFHGSGGRSNQVVDYGPSLKPDEPTPGRGPAWEHARSGVASVGSALPVNPERLVAAGVPCLAANGKPKSSCETAYLNLQNPAAMRDTFRQGIIEQRLLLQALLALRLPAAALGDCGGGAMPTLPAGATAFKFDPGKVVAQGQSMGGMYTNLVSAVEPKVRLAVPTGAGGFWTYFVLQTHLQGGAFPELLPLLLRTGKPLTWLHPVLSMMQSAWEPCDPFVAMPRLARQPLPGHPVRPIYEPVGRGDEYFPTQLYDAVALAYGHQQAGLEVWPTMQPVLRLAGLDGLLPFPAAQNRASEGGVPYTGVVVQFEGDGIEDPHAIYRQLATVRRQYSCFVNSFLTTGVAKVPGPAAADAPCE